MFQSDGTHVAACTYTVVADALPAERSGPFHSGGQLLQSPSWRSAVRGPWNCSVSGGSDLTSLQRLSSLFVLESQPIPKFL